MSLLKSIGNVIGRGVGMLQDTPILGEMMRLSTRASGKVLDEVGGGLGITDLERYGVRMQDSPREAQQELAKAAAAIAAIYAGGSAAVGSTAGPTAATAGSSSGVGAGVTGSTAASSSAPFAGGPATNPGFAQMLMQQLSKTASTPMGRYGMIRAGAGLYGAIENRRMRRRLRDTDITEMPGYRTGEASVKRRMAAMGRGNSSGTLAALQDYGAQQYDRFAENERANYQANTGALMNDMNLIAMMAALGG